jgi:hypothetical protein
MSIARRIDELDLRLQEQIPASGTSMADRRSLLAVHAAIASRGDFTYLEAGSRHSGTRLQSFLADARCRRVVCVEDAASTALAARFSALPEGDLAKLTTADAARTDVDPAALGADLCFVDGDPTDEAALRHARFCRQAIRGRGVIVFHDRTLVSRAIRRFLGELGRYRAYPLANELFVVEVDVPTLLSDARVRAQVPRRLWLAVDRVRAVRLALGLATAARAAQSAYGSAILALAAPRRARYRPSGKDARDGAVFEIHSFVNDESLYEDMRRSFADAGFSDDAFVALSDSSDDPYAAITRIGRESGARYPILCHQDLLAVDGSGRDRLLAALKELDALDPDWVVAGNAGVMRSGRIVVRLVDPDAGSTGEPLPLPVVTLDEQFLVFNGRRHPRCSEGLSGFHLYGADVCLNALTSGGSAYVVDFPLRHLGKATTGPAFEHAKSRFASVWSRRYRFLFVPTTVDIIFISRSATLKRLQHSLRMSGAVDRSRRRRDGFPLEPVDRLSARLLIRRTRLLRRLARRR